MNIIVFGGTFNPPHLGHLLMAEQMLLRAIPDVFGKEKKFADRLCFLPVGQHSFEKEAIPRDSRKKMVELLIADIKERQPDLAKKIYLEEYELKAEGISHTADTLDALQKAQVNDHFVFLIGSDNLAQFDQWWDGQGRDFHYLLSRYSVLVYPRQGYPFAPLYENMFALEDFPEMKISSTELRSQLERGEQVEQFLSPSVAAYIKRTNPYLSKEK